MKRDDDDEAISDDELAAAAVTLASLADGAPLPARVRQRVEASGRSVLGERASAHARRRASDVRATSTTSAGTQVIIAMAEAPPPRPRRLASYAWGGAVAFAVAAAVTLLVRSRLPAPAASAHDVERIALGGPSGAVGELRYDRSDGTAALTIARGPALATADESLELWIRFEGDVAPRAVALLNATSSDVAFGAGQPICRPVPGSSCAPVEEVIVTRESPLGSLAFVADRTVLRGRGPQR